MKRNDNSTEIVSLVASDCCEVKVEPIDLVKFEVDKDKFDLQMKSIGDSLSGIKFELKLTFPIEAALYFFANRALKRFEKTDVGEYMKNIFTSEISNVIDKVTKICHAEFHMALDGLKELFDIMLFEPETLKELSDRAKEEICKMTGKVVDNAKTAFIR